MALGGVIGGVVSDFANSLFNEYNPTGSYSWEFFSRNERGDDGGMKSIEEIILLLPPESVSIREGYLITAQKTIGGFQIDDFGNDAKTITVRGNIYFYYAGRPPEPVKGTGVKKYLNNMVGQAKKLGRDMATKILPAALLQNIPGLGYLTGLQELFRLKYALSRLRDSYTNEKGIAYKTNVPKNLRQVKDLKQLEGLTMKDVMIVFHDYDENNHFEVIFEDFTIDREARDNSSFSYSITMKAIREVENADGFAVGDLGIKPKAESVALNVLSLITTALGPVDKLFNMGVETIQGFASIFNDLADLAGTEGLLAKMIDERRTKWFLATKAFDDAYARLADKEQDASDNSNAAADTIAVLGTGVDLEDPIDASNGLLPSPNGLPGDTPATIAIRDAIAAQEAYALLSGSMASAALAYGIASNFEPHLTEQFEIEKNISFSDANSVVSEEEFYSTYVIISEQRRVGVDEYTVQEGDNPYNLAYRFYGDYQKYFIITRYNKLFLTDFDLGALVGRKIRIPKLDSEPKPANIYNEVYVKRVLFPTSYEKEIELFGCDIKLNQGELVANGDGDMDMEEGVACYIENISDRLSNFRGSLNEMNPGWGLKPIIGYAQQANAVNVIAQLVEAQVEKDPRTKQAFFDKTSVQVKQDALFYILNISSIAEDYDSKIGSTFSSRIV